MQHKISSFVLIYFWEYYTYDIISSVQCASWKFSSCAICIKYYSCLFVLACSRSVKCEAVCISWGSGMISNFQIWDICVSFPVRAIGLRDSKCKISLIFHTTEYYLILYTLNLRWMNMKEHMVASSIESQLHLARDVLMKGIVSPLYMTQFHRFWCHHV